MMCQPKNCNWNRQGAEDAKKDAKTRKSPSSSKRGFLFEGFCVEILGVLGVLAVQMHFSGLKVCGRVPFLFRLALENGCDAFSASCSVGP